MKDLKIALIGIGSGSFGLSALRDAANTPQVFGATLALVDTNAERLDLMTSLAHLVNEDSGAGFVLESHLDRRQALDGADFVIVAISVNRNELWRLDFEVPLRHGIRHVLGENGGPGGLFHTMRMAQPVVDIARDMENLCPEAWLINFSNPESRVCLAVTRETGVKTVGLCHGIWMQRDNLAPLLETPAEQIDVTAAGLNHLTWIQQIEDRRTGEDLYPRLRERLLSAEPYFQPLCRRLFAQYGLYPSPDDSHVGEYFADADEYVGVKGYDFESDERNRIVQNMQILRWLNREESVRPLTMRPSGEIAFPIIGAMLENTGERFLAVNVANADGAIEGLPREAVVEVPAVVDSAGIHPERVEPLPGEITALLRTQVEVQLKAVEAGLTGSRQAAKEALMIDPVMKGNADAADKILDELWKAQQRYLPPMAP